MLFSIFNMHMDIFEVLRALHLKTWLNLVLSTFSSLFALGMLCVCARVCTHLGSCKHLLKSPVWFISSFHQLIRSSPHPYRGAFIPFVQHVYIICH